MRNIKDETEVLQVSIYCNIICRILINHENLSLCKLLVFSYLIKQNRFMGGNIHCKNTQDIIYKGLSLLVGDYDGFCNSTGYILKSIYLLLKKGTITAENELLCLYDNTLHVESINEESAFLKKVIEASKQMTDKQFMKEVTYNV